MATQLNASDPRVKRTRRLLQEAFMDLIGEKSFHSISVQDIAERATVNRATFYAHFEDKHALVDSIMRERFQERLASSGVSGAPIAPASLQPLCMAVFEYLEKLYGHCEIDRQFDPLVERAMHETLYAFIVDWLAPSLLPAARNRATLEATVLVMTSTIVGSGMQWSRGGRSLPATDLAKQVVALLTGGVTGLLQESKP